MTVDCPQPFQLKALLDGRLDADNEQLVSSHLDTCRKCQQTLEQLVDGGTLARNVRDRLGEDSQTPLDVGNVISRFQSEIAAAAENPTPSPNDAPSEEFANDDAAQPSPANEEVPFEAAETRFAPTSSTSDPNGMPEQIDDIEIIEELGRGGMGVVFKGFEPSLKRFVAVKMLAERLAKDREARDRFVREARSMAAIQHRYIVAIHRIIDRSAGVPPCLVMEFVDGMSLSQRISKKGPLPIREAIRTSIQIAAGLAAAHERGIVHRDIKPANILIERSTRDVRITDFGLARASADVSITQTGLMIGTPAFMSPEQAQGQRVDHRSDLFSLGSVIYAMLTGRPPFVGSSSFKTMTKLISDPPEPVHVHRNDVPEWLVEILLRLHAKSADDRFQSAEEVVRRLMEGRAELVSRVKPSVNAPTEIGMPALQTQPVRIIRPKDVAKSASRSSDSQFAAQTVQQRGTMAAMAMAGIVLTALIVVGLEFAGVIDVVRDDAERERSTDAFHAMADLRKSGFRHPDNVGVNVPNAGDNIVVFLDGKQSPRKYDSIGQAVHLAPNNAVIELRFNGPMHTPPLWVDDRRNLTIRAAAGFRPKLEPARGHEQNLKALITSTGELQLEGLELTLGQRPDGVAAADGLEHVVLCQGGSLKMNHCRVWMESGRSCIRLVGTDHSQIANTEVYATIVTGVEWHPVQNSRLHINNSVIAAPAAVALQHPRADNGKPVLHLDHSILVGRCAVQLVVSAYELGDIPKDDYVEVIADHSVLDSKTALLCIDVPNEHIEENVVFQPWEIPERIRSALKWQGAWSLISPAGRFIAWRPPTTRANQPKWLPTHLFGWHQFWEEDRSRLTKPQALREPIRYFQGNRPLPHLPMPYGQPINFTVRNQLPGPFKAQPIGIDASKVGIDTSRP